MSFHRLRLIGFMIIACGCSIRDIPSDPAAEAKMIAPTTPPSTTKEGAPDKKTVEKQKIEALLAGVAALKEAQFDRNGTWYNAKTAADSMRMKWGQQSMKVTSAKDFITHVATTSSSTGKPYLIKLKKDGPPMPLGEYLTGELKKIEEKR